MNSFCGPNSRLRLVNSKMTSSDWIVSQIVFSSLSVLFTSGCRRYVNAWEFNRQINSIKIVCNLLVNTLLYLIRKKIICSIYYIILSLVKKSNIFKIHLFHITFSSNLLTYLQTYCWRETYWYKNYNETSFGVLLLHNAYFLMLSLKRVFMTLLMRIIWFLNNNGL